MADVVVEKDRSSNTGVIVAVVAIVILVLAALFILPGMLDGSTNGGSTTPTTPSVQTTTGQ